MDYAERKQREGWDRKEILQIIKKFEALVKRRDGKWVVKQVG